MHHVIRLWLAFGVLTILPLRAAPPTQSEYKQADSSYYLRSDVFAVDPATSIIAPADATNMGSSYLIATRGRAPQFVYLQDTHDWIEPITPPSEPASLNISPTEMQVREPQGSVQVALPSAPADFHDVERGMTLPDGAVLRTGDSGSVAVLFGGVDSVRLAPNSQAAVQMKFEGGTRDVEVDIRSGMVFSKVGSRPGEKQAYAVHTQFGNATAHGTDYVTVVYPQRVDVCVAQGTVQLTSPGGATQTTSSDGKSPLKVMRFPVAKDAVATMTESAESLTALLNFIPLANQKLKVLAERTQSGAHLTATEQDYVGRVRKVGTLIKLANMSAPPMPIAATPPPPSAVATVPPVKKAPLRALPVQNSILSVAKADSSSPLAMQSKNPSVSTALPVTKRASYKSKPVVIVLPAAHFPKVARDEDGEIAPPVKTGMETVAVTTVVPTKAGGTTKTKKDSGVASASKTKPVVGDHYLRAKVVDADELAETPAVKSAPRVGATKRAAAEVDPNSLGAPLQPMRPMPTPIVAEPTASSSLPVAAKPAASYTVP